MGRIYLPSSEPPAESEQQTVDSFSNRGGRIYLPSSAPPPEQPQAEEVEAEEQPELETDESEEVEGGPAEGVTLPEPDESEPEQVLLEEPEPSPVGAQTARPGVRDPKEVWVEYAESQGWDGDPEETSKKSLIEQYGQQEQQES